MAMCLKCMVQMAEANDALEPLLKYVCPRCGRRFTAWNEELVPGPSGLKPEGAPSPIHVDAFGAIRRLFGRKK